MKGCLSYKISSIESKRGPFKTGKGSSKSLLIRMRGLKQRTIIDSQRSQGSWTLQVPQQIRIGCVWRRSKTGLTVDLRKWSQMPVWSLQNKPNLKWLLKTLSSLSSKIWLPWTKSLFRKWRRELTSRWWSKTSVGLACNLMSKTWHCKNNLSSINSSIVSESMLLTTSILHWEMQKHQRVNSVNPPSSLRFWAKGATESSV